MQVSATEGFDSLAELVRDVLDVPVAIVSIVSNDRQVFAGHCGLPPEWAERGETPLTHSFCKHVVERAAPMIVPDARADPTVKDNKAIEDLGVAAYIGVPIHLPSGEVAGALAAIASSPRVWTPADLRRLTRIAGVATEKIAVRVAELGWRSLFDGMQDGFILGEMIRDDDRRIVDWRHIEVNPAFEDLIGPSVIHARGRTIREMFPGIEPEWIDDFAQVVESGQAAQFTRQLGALGRWYEGLAQPVGGDRFTIIFTDVTERMLADKAKAALADRRQLAIETGEVGIWDWDLLSGTLLLDDRMKMLNGVFEGRDLGIDRAFEAIHPDDRQRVERDLQALADGTHDDLEIEYRVIGIEDGIVRSVIVNGVSVKREDGTVVRLVGTGRDVSDGVAREERRKTLNQELAHRLKNTLAIVTAIVNQTLRSAKDVETGRKTLLDRVHALSKAHDILLSGQHDAANVRAIVMGAVALHDDGGRIRTKGPNMPIGPKASMTLSLIVHELATNAGKYGSLSVASGFVDVEWSVTRDSADNHPILRIDWLERGGPAVQAPKVKGFGTRLVEMGLSGSAGGSTTLDYDADGFRCVINAPLVELMTAEETS